MAVAAEAHLNDAIEGRYRLLVDAISDYAIYMLDQNGFVTSWNSGAARLKGYSEDEVLGEHFSRFYPDEDRAAGLPERALARARTEGRVESEGWRIRKDGRPFWAHVVLDAIRSPGGDLIGFAKITRDLSERKKAEAELKRSEEQFRLLVQGVTDYAIYMLDPDGRVSSWNVGAERIKGYCESEVLGRHFSLFYTPEDLEAGLPALALETARREGRFEREGWRLRKDGTRFWASVIIDSLTAEDGSPIGFAKITRDITEKREAQRALELAQQELFQAQKMEAVGRLTGGMAHDFNNLLMAIQGSLEIARKRSKRAQDVTPLIENAMQAVQRGSALTQRMLAFSRRQQLSFEAVDVIALVHGMTELLRRSIGPLVEIETHFPLSLPKVRSDPNQLENALLNLAINARDAMPEGGTLLIAAKATSRSTDTPGGLRAGDYVCLSVSDEGEGMDAETLEQALTPFFTTKDVGKGSGLGLPMVQGLMGQTGGALELTSQKGEGTIAKLWLPVMTEIEIAATPVEPQEAVPVLDRKLRVIAVDDDPLVLMNTVLMLEDLGHTVMEAHSAAEALDLLAGENDIDLVLTDHAMPRMTGMELIETLRKSGRSIPVLLASGYAELREGEETTISRLAKPFTQIQLEQALAAAVLKRS